MSIEPETWELPEEFIRHVAPEASSKSVLVFTDPRMTENVADYALEQGYNAQYLNSDIAPKIRKRIVRDFNSGKIRFLITIPKFAEEFHLI